MKKGFTLIELLVVIAIIAILAAILFPVFAQAKLSAKSTVDLSNMKELGTATQIYLNDYDDAFPLFWEREPYSANSYPNIQVNIGLRWSGSSAVQPYIKNLAIFKSPVENQNLSNLPAQIFTDSGIVPSKVGVNSYAANALWVENNEVNFGPNPPGPQAGLFGDGGLACLYVPVPCSGNSTSSQVSYPSDLIALRDGATDNNALLAETYGEGYLNATNTEFSIFAEDPWDSGYLLNEVTDGAYYGEKAVHDIREFFGGANFVMADTHAKRMMPGQLYKIGSSGPYLNQKNWVVSPSTSN